MGTPATLPANFFEKQGASSAKAPPKTLPANFDFKKGAAPPEAKTEPVKQPAAPPEKKGNNRWYEMDSGIRPNEPFDLNKYLDSPQGKAVQQANIDTAKFGADALALRTVFGPSQVMKQGPLVPAGRAANGRMLPWIRSQVYGEGPSIASKAVQGLASGAKGVLDWAKANPATALLLEETARHLGLDPASLIRKVIKFGGTAKKTHVP